MAINNIMIEGNLTADAELRYTNSGKAVASFTIAHTPRRFDKATNEWKDGETAFLRVNAWDKLGENTATLTKGARAIVSGRLQQRNWEDKEGNKRVSFEITADGVGGSLAYATADGARDQSAGAMNAANKGSSDPWGGSDEQPPF